MSPAYTGYIVSDICDTLFYANTTFDFIRFCIRKQKIPAKTIRIYQLFQSRKSPFFYALALLQKISGKDHLKARALKLFKGVSTKEMEQWAEEFYAEDLSNLKIRQTHELLSRFDNEKIILASSTIEPVALIISKKLSANHYVATSLEIKDNVYTGRIQCDLTGEKTKAVEAIIPHSEIISVAMSDNHTDRLLLEKAIQKIAICYKKSDVQFWKKMPGVTILMVSKKH
ncbi:HAD family hydrolase [Niabella drilacis]|nr:haloacid dehalogenase-like hydrolase [Niabella drilacis]